MTKIKITVPDMGDFKDVEIIEVLVKNGQTIVTHLLSPAILWAAVPIPVSAIVEIKPPWAIFPVFKWISFTSTLNS